MLIHNCQDRFYVSCIRINILLVMRVPHEQITEHTTAKKCVCACQRIVWACMCSRARTQRKYSATCARADILRQTNDTRAKRRAFASYLARVMNGITAASVPACSREVCARAYITHVRVRWVCACGRVCVWVICLWAAKRRDL